MEGPRLRFSSSLLCNGSGSLPSGCVFRPFEALPSECPQLSDTEQVKCECGAYATPWSLDSAKASWACSFCGISSACHSPSHSQFLNKSLQFTGGQRAASRGSALVIVLDNNLTKAQLNDIAASMRAAFSALKGEIGWLSLVTFSSVVTVYRCSLSGVASGDVFPDASSFMSSPNHTKHAYVAPATSSREAFLSILGALRGARRKVSGEAVEGTRRARRREQFAFERRPRCLGAAVRIALQVAKGAPTNGAAASSRIIVCTTGAPESTTAELSALGAMARSQGAGLDVFAAGLEPLEVPMMEALVEPTGGYVVQQQSFAASEFGLSLATSLVEQHLPRCGAPVSTLEVRTSAGVTLKQLVGPAEVQQAGSTDGTPVFELLRWDPRVAVSLYFDVNSAKEQHASFQLFVKSCADGEIVQRVFSHRIAVREATYEDGAEAAFLASLDAEVLAVLAVKRAVLAANDSSTGTFETARVQARGYAEDTLRTIIKHHRLTSQSSSGLLLPEALAALPRLLYFAVRGPLLGDAYKSVDEVRGLRHAFLRAGVDDSLAIMAPALLSTQRHVSNDLMTLVTADTLALWSDAHCCCDTWSRLFLWRGSDASDVDEEACAEFLNESIVQRRFPAPTVVVCVEGSSMARFVVSRLNPSHNDSAEEQVASLPALALMSNEERELIKAKWLWTDVPSLKQWLRRVAGGR